MQWVPRIRHFVSSARTDIMDSILNQLSSGTLSESFSNERINPGIALSMKDSDLAGLGVNTIRDRIRLRELCTNYVAAPHII